MCSKNNYYSSGTLCHLADRISDLKVRQLVLNVIPYIPEYFYSIPSSSTGKYHPQDENAVGGLVRHTIRTVKVAEDMSRMYDLTEQELNLTYAALILHDSCKNGLTYSDYTVFNHPLLAAKLFADCNNSFSTYKQKKACKIIYKLIASHMGRWNVDPHNQKVKLPKPKTKLEKFVHECDYIASRRDFNISINECEE